ncbi:tRNA uridine-5-carboxymethylaminomethyl(34) synthesis GTPase MnmE [Candidatus Sumerlaeota bacterium]|nr:tRNA uridine-5-carboxymethylaminomethyl(34) synthesis GTPase MnmE [Candidatus Sumerlaeota bacterium]
MARNLALHGTKDLIVALATAPGVGAIAIIRLSGVGVRAAASQIFHGVRLRDEPGVLNLGALSHPETHAVIDHCLMVHWEGPRSYTGEDMVEFQLHGSPAVCDAAIQACLLVGARLAEPGEFTRRAFLNGKIDLTQAQAVSDLTRSQTEDARRAAMSQLRGGLSDKLVAVRAALLDVTAEIEARLDFPEEDLPHENRQAMRRKLVEAGKDLELLLGSFRRGRRLQEGARVVLAGPPNAGKSSLFNALVGRERAIVSPHAGTTRDSIEAVVELGGMPVTLVDTAGLRSEPEEIERLGIQKTHEEIEGADLILFVIDYRERNAAYDEYRAMKDRDHIVVFNKAEHLVGVLIGGVSEFEPNESHRHGIQFLSARERKGLDALENAIIRELVGGPANDTGGVTITNERQAGALRRASEATAAASALLEGGHPLELVVVDLSVALSEIDSITGKTQLDEEILDAIFSRFCLGK